jgi:hypothetical protein
MVWNQKLCPLLQVDYVENDEQVKSAGYPATLVTTKQCNLLSIATTDLLRFGSGVQESLQTAAWSRQVALLELQERVMEANEELRIAVSSARSLPGMLPHLVCTSASHWRERLHMNVVGLKLNQSVLWRLGSTAESLRWAAAQKPAGTEAAGAEDSYQQALHVPVQDSRPSWAILPGERDPNESPNTGNLIEDTGKLPGEPGQSTWPFFVFILTSCFWGWLWYLKETYILGMFNAEVSWSALKDFLMGAEESYIPRASWLRMVGGGAPTLGLAGAHIQRTLSGQMSQVGAGWEFWCLAQLEVVALRRYSW